MASRASYKMTAHTFGGPSAFAAKKPLPSAAAPSFYGNLLDQVIGPSKSSRPSAHAYGRQSQPQAPQERNFRKRTFAEASHSFSQKELPSKEAAKSQRRPERRGVGRRPGAWVRQQSHCEM